MCVVRAVPIAANGSSHRNRSTGQPRNCQIRSPTVLTIQNQRNTAKKKAWLIRLVVTIFIIAFSAYRCPLGLERFVIGCPGTGLVGLGKVRQVGGS